MLGVGHNRATLDHLMMVTVTALVVALCGLPGFFVAIRYMERKGRKNLQLWSFLALTAVYSVLAMWAPFVSVGGDLSAEIPFLLLYAFTFLLCNVPNTTTYILSSESFPSRVRSTFSGISAAMGKLGAVLGASSFDLILTAGEGARDKNTTSNAHDETKSDKASKGLAGLEVVLALCAVFALLGAVFTYFFVLDLRDKDIDSTIKANDNRTGQQQPRHRDNEDEDELLGDATDYDPDNDDRDGRFTIELTDIRDDDDMNEI